MSEKNYSDKWWRHKSFRYSILGSLFAALLILIIIKPLLYFLWNIFVTFVPGFLSYFVDSVYKNAALGHRNWLDVLIIFFGFVLLILVPQLLLVRTKKNKEKIQKVIVDENEETDKRKIIKKSEKLAKIIDWILTLFFLIFTLYFLMSIYADLQINTSFQQRMRVLAPHIKEQEEEEIQAMWALMKNRSDYLKINEHLERKAEEVGVILPKPLL